MSDTPLSSQGFPMTYNELLQRCRRIVGMSPETKASLHDCIRILRQWDGHARGITAENLANELSEYVEMLQMMEASKRSGPEEKP